MCVDSLYNSSSLLQKVNLGMTDHYTSNGFFFYSMLDEDVERLITSADIRCSPNGYLPNRFPCGCGVEGYPNDNRGRITLNYLIVRPTITETLRDLITTFCYQDGVRLTDHNDVNCPPSRPTSSHNRSENRTLLSLQYPELKIHRQRHRTNLPRRTNRKTMIRRW